MRSVRLLLALLLVVCFIFSLAHGEEPEENHDDGSEPKITPKIVFPRRRLFRKRFNQVHDGDAEEGGSNVTTSVSMSVSTSASNNSNANTNIEIHTKSEKPLPKFFKTAQRPRIKFVKPESSSKFTKSERPLPNYLKTESTTQKQTTQTPPSSTPAQLEPEPDYETESESESVPQPTPDVLTPRPKFVMPKRPLLKFTKFPSTRSTTQKPKARSEEQISKPKEEPEVESELKVKSVEVTQKPVPKFFKSNRTFSKFVKPESAAVKSEFAKRKEKQAITEKPRPKFFQSERPLPKFLKSRTSQSEEHAETPPPKIFKPSIRPFPKFMKSDRFLPKFVKTDRTLQVSGSESISDQESDYQDPVEPEPSEEPETTTKSKFLVPPKSRPSFFKSRPWNSKIKSAYSNEVDPPSSTTQSTTTTLAPQQTRLNLFSRFKNRPKLTFNKFSNSPTKNQIEIIPTVTSTIGKNKQALTEEPLTETPSSSFKPKIRPSFGRAPTNRPLVKSTLKKLFRPTLRTTAATNYEESIAEDEAVHEAEHTTSTTPAAPTITTTPTAEEISNPQRTGTQSTTNTISPTPDTTFNAAASQPTEVSESASASASAETQAASSSVETRTNVKNKNMIIIPVPPSQRKPYHPVIMQVTKTPAVSSTERPQTKVVTYKLNKMFVPMGIYGKVLPKSEAAAGNYSDGTGQEQPGMFQETADLISATQAPHTHNNLFPSSTISPSIRHKGSSSEEQLLASGDNSGEYSTASLRPAIPASDADSVFASQEWRPAFSPEQRQQSKNRKKNINSRERGQGGKQFFDASTVDLTTNYKPDISTISLTTERPNIDAISLTSTEVPAYLGTSLGQGANDNRRENYKNQNTMFQMGPPRPFDKNSNRPNSLMDSIKNAAASAASSIPGIIHGGLTQLSQLSQPFEDSFFGSTQASPVKSNSGHGTGGVTLGAPDDETLEYFRKRPHLLSKGQGHSFHQPSYSSGFKPVTAPAHFAKAYYASTTTSPSKSEPTTSYSHPSSTTARPSYDAPTYDSHKPSLLTRSPKNVQEWKDSYVDQLLESSNKFKYASTASPIETDILRSHWREMSQKYTKNELDEATNRIYSLMSSSSAPSMDELLYMKPPSHGQLSRSSSSAFHDLLKMFRLGVTYGSYSSTSKPYEATVGNLRSRATVNHGSDIDGWRPIKYGSSPAPFVSFNAGISFGPTPTPSQPRPTSLYPGHGGTHYSSSSKPFIPGSSIKTTHSYSKPSASSLSSYFGSSLNSYSSGGSSKGPRGYSSHPSSGSSLSAAYNSPPPRYSSYPRSPSTPDFSDVYYGGSTLKGGENGEVRHEDEDENGYKPPSNLASLYQNDPGLELIPSSVYYKQKEQGIIQSGEIAAVLKPADMSDETLRQQVPEGVANVPQITYPGGKVPQNFQTLEQVNEYFQNSEPTTENQVHFQPPLYRLIQQSLQSQDSQLSYHQQQAMKSHQQGTRQSYKSASEEEEPSPHNYYEASQESHHQHQHHQEKHRQPDQHEQEQSPSHHLQYEPPPPTASQTTVHHHHVHQPAEVQHHYQPQPNHYQLPQSHQLQHSHQPQPQQQQEHIQHYQHQHAPQQHHSGGGVAVKATGDSGLGFSDFELPAGVDPDIAALLKAELDKDDIPEEFRKEFAEQEKNKQNKQQQQEVAASGTSAVFAKPPSLVKTTTTSSVTAASQKDAVAQRREDVIKTVFHKPIPISPTLLTPQSSKSKAPLRIPATIPRYVLDLARKLKNDKDLQGIVRVTSKKEGGPPIEYLYPVRGR